MSLCQLVKGEIIMTALVKNEGFDENNLFGDIEKMQMMAKKLMISKHYQKIGEDGIFAIGMMAKTLGMPVLEALNGELYYVQGKVGMSAEAMNKRIRMKGHSVTVKRLDENGCTLIGKRGDNGDTAEISYTIEDMKSAGKNYEKNRKDMFFARCLSRLKRILFPDVCTKCYEKSELEDISEETQIGNLQNQEESTAITTAQAIELNNLLKDCDPQVQKNAMQFIKDKFNIELIDELPSSEFEKYKTLFIMRRDEYQKKLAEAEMNNTKPQEEENGN